MHSFTASSLKTQYPVFAHAPQAVQSWIGLFPMWNIRVSIPCFPSCDATSLSAVNVHPFACGLPLIRRTFIVPPPPFDRPQTPRPGPDIRRLPQNAVRRIVFLRFPRVA